MAGRARAFGTALRDVIVRTLVFAAAFGGVGLGLNAYAAFGPGEPDPRFSDEIIFGSSNVVLLLIARVAVVAFLLGSTIAIAVVTRRPLWRGCVVAGAAGTASLLAAMLLFAAQAAEIVPAAVAVLGVASGVVCVRAPKAKSRGAGAA